MICFFELARRTPWSNIAFERVEDFFTGYEPLWKGQSQYVPLKSDSAKFRDFVHTNTTNPSPAPPPTPTNVQSPNLQSVLLHHLHPSNSSRRHKNPPIDMSMAQNARRFGLVAVSGTIYVGAVWVIIFYDCCHEIFQSRTITYYQD